MGTEGAPDHWFAGPVDEPRRYTVTAEDFDRVESGGEGLVYRATGVDTGRVVALKLLTTATTADYERIERRATSFAGIVHPNLMEHVEVFLGAALTSDGPSVAPNEFDLVMSVSTWIEGRTLGDLVLDARVRKRLGWTTDLAHGLHRLHSTRSPGVEHGIVHRDVKPSNVRIAADGRAVLIDFGVARPVDHSDMTVGIGTYRWRAPEALSDTGGPVGTASDVWGLGAVAHWMLVGDPPALDGSGASRERMELALGERRNGAAIARHVAELLHSSPTKRPTDLETWAAQLDRLAREPSARRRRMRTALLGAASAVGLVAFLPTSDDQVAGPPPGPTTTAEVAVLAETTYAPTSAAPPTVAATTTAPPPSLSSTTIPAPVVAAIPPGACRQFGIVAQSLDSSLNKLVGELLTNDAKTAFGLGGEDIEIVKALNLLAITAEPIEGLSSDAGLVRPADLTLSRGLIVAWLATAGDGRQVDRREVDYAISITAPLVQAVEPGPPDRPPLDQRLRALARIYQAFGDRGCKSALWRSRELRNHQAAEPLRSSTSLAEFYLRIDAMHDQFF